MDELSPQQQLEALVARALARDENPDDQQVQREQMSSATSSTSNVYLDYPEEALLASDVESMNLSPASSLTLTSTPPPGPSTDTQAPLPTPGPSTETSKWTTVRGRSPASTPSGSPHRSSRRRRASSPVFAEEMLHEEAVAMPSPSAHHLYPVDTSVQSIQDEIVSLRERLFDSVEQGVSLLRPGHQPPIQHVLTPQRRPPPTFTPEGHNHYLIGHHPWAHLVTPRPIDVLRSRAVQPVLDLPTEEYRHLPSGGYRNTRFARSLFPRIAVRADCPVLQIPFIELQHLEDTITFRDRTLRMIEDLQDGTYDDFREIDSPVHPERLHCMIAPETWRGRRPVLYQVVSTGWRNGVILEAKDFFLPGPDRRDLHCIILDYDAINVTSGQQGLNRGLIAVKDFVWVYAVKPTRQAFMHPEGALKRARIPRTTALDNNSVYYFRVSHYAFVTPREREDRVYGLVLSVKRRRTGINSFKAAFEGAPDSIVVPNGVCRFDMQTVKEDEFLIADTRYNASSAMRFSEPPASLAARDQLCQLITTFLPTHPAEAIRPIRVYRLSKEEREWLLDRADRFDNFERDHSVALIKMLKLFNAAASAQAALPFLSDDQQTHWIAAVVPSLTVYTIRLDFVLHDMANEAGWAAQRPVALWIAGSATLAFVKVRSVAMNPDQRTLAVSTEAYHYSHRSILKDVSKHARRVGPNLVVDVGVHLVKSPLASNPVYESISRADLSRTAPAGTFGDRAMNAMYGRARIGCLLRHSQVPTSAQLTDPSFSLKGRRINLNNDQQKAISLAFTGYPIVGIQAAFGTGKTVIGALIAAHLCKAKVSVIVTSTTNAAVAQFAQTFLALDDFKDVPIVRYVSDSAVAAESAYSTPSDLNVILKGLGEKYATQMTSAERSRCREFKEGREVLELALKDPERALQMSEEQSEECYISDKYVSRNLQKMVDLMFRLHAPAVIFATTASLINIIGPKGIFRKHISRFSVLIGDEASQIPEPVVVMLAMTLPTVRHVYIGDVHQLQPHVRCPRNSNMAIFGARSVMQILMKARAVPIAPLHTTFRSHPALLELPNRVAYSGALVSGVKPEERQRLFAAMTFPSPNVPYMFIDVKADSTRSVSKSHFNPTEAATCWHLVQLLLKSGIAAADIAIITFYRAQFSRMEEEAQRLGVELATVDSVQGREKEVVLILTTRTDAEVGTADFLDDYRRTNVSLTRCRQGQFVFGRSDSLSRIPFWSRVLSWSQSLNAVVDSNRIDQYFHNL